MKLNNSSFQYMFALLLTVSSLAAQSITGTITSNDGDALAGANISVEGTDTGASSNVDGSFAISGLSDGTYTVTASYIGYEDTSAVVTISGGTAASLNLTLDQSNLLLNQVVVSASFKKEMIVDSPASVEVFSGKELEARNATTIVDLLANKAGVETMKMGVESSNMTVRGFNSVFSGAIHAVVDNRWTRAPVVNAQLLQFMAPDDSDVQRVELVRGPATPMYGPDTQQGVIALYTKSPFNQGNRVALTVGDRAYSKLYARVAHQWSPRAATRLSIKTVTFEDWPSNMPRTAAEAAAAGHTYFEPVTIRRGLQTTVYPYVDYANETTYNDPVEGSRNTASADEPYKPESTTVDMKTEFRPDLKSTLTVNLRAAELSAVEMTGVGRQHADNATLYQMQLAYSRQDFLGGDLFLNLFSNSNEQKTTYNLSNGLLVSDTSSNIAFQLQHNIELKNGQSIVWGMDYLSRTPETAGSINGQHEDIDDFSNIGAYYSYEKKWGDTFKFVGTGRVDNSNYLRDIGTDYLFAPKLALVYSPDAIRGSFRLTYGQNMDLPGNFTKNLDIGVGTNFVYNGVLGLDFQSSNPALNPLVAMGQSPLPFNPDFQVKAMGSSTVGYTYERDADGNPMFRSNWSNAIQQGVNTYYELGNSTINAAAWGVFAPVIAGSFVQDPTTGGAITAGYGAALGTAYGTALALGAPLSSLGLSAEAEAAFSGALAAGGTSTDAVTAAAGTMALQAANSYVALASMSTPSSYSNQLWDLTLNPSSTSDYVDYDVVKETVWTQTELGYKGQISDKMTLAVDVYDINVEGYVTNLQSMSGLVAVNADVTSLIGSMVANTATIDAVNGNTNLADFIGAMDGALGTDANVAVGGYDEAAIVLQQGVIAAPMGAISPQNSPYGGNLIVGYKQMSEDLNLKGMEATLNYFPNTDWNFYMNMSFLNDNVLEAMHEGVEQVIEMNTPKFKLGAGFNYFGENNSFGMTLRHQDSYLGQTGFALGTVDGFYTVGVSARWNVQSVDGMSVGLMIDNVTDNVHKEMFLGPEMGRMTTLQIGYDL